MFESHEIYPASLIRGGYDNDNDDDNDDNNNNNDNNAGAKGTTRRGGDCLLSLWEEQQDKGSTKAMSTGRAGEGGWEGRGVGNDKGGLLFFKSGKNNTPTPAPAPLSKGYPTRAEPYDAKNSNCFPGCPMKRAHRCHPPEPRVFT